MIIPAKISIHFTMLIVILFLAAMPGSMADQEETESLERYWDLESFSTEATFTPEDYEGYQIPMNEDMKKESTQGYSHLRRRMLSVNMENNILYEKNYVESVSPSPEDVTDNVQTPQTTRQKIPHFRKLISPMIIVGKKKNDKKQYNRKFKYDPALILMGLGKRKQMDNLVEEHNKTLNKRHDSHDSTSSYLELGKKKYSSDPAIKYMGLGKRNLNNNSSDKSLSKRSLKPKPLMMIMGISKSVVTFDKQNISENLDTSENTLHALESKRAKQTTDYLMSDESFVSPVAKDISGHKISSVMNPSHLPTETFTFSERITSSNNPHLKYETPEQRIKRNSKYDPALQYMGLGKKDMKNDPSLQYSSSEKRKSNYDPALHYMGLGKKGFSYDPALHYMGLGKKSSSYDPALRYMGLGKKSHNYDPALRYMGLGKKSSNYDPALKYMGLGKKSSNYDPALRYMGLGKKSSNYDPALKYMGLGKKSSTYDPALRYMGLGKKNSNYDPVLKFMSLEKKSSNYDPALKYMGLGKKSSYYDPAFRYMGLGKKSSNYDPALRYMGLGKKSSNYDPALTYMGLGKKSFDYDPENKYVSLERRSPNYDPALRYMGLGKKSPSFDPALKYMGLGKKSSSYDPALKYMGLGNKNYNLDPALKYMGLGKKSKSYDPALKYMGLGKRERSNINSGASVYDPALIYMGLGKRKDGSQSDEKFHYDPAFKYTIHNEAPNHSAPGNNSHDHNLQSQDLEKEGYETTESEVRLMKQQYNSDPQLQRTHEQEHETVGISKRPSNLDPGLKLMGLGKRNDKELHPNDKVTKSERFGKSYPDPELVRKLVDYFDSLRSQPVGNAVSTENGGNSGSFEDANIQNAATNGNSDYVTNLKKKETQYDPALKYMGLGKRNTSIKPVSEMFSTSDKFDATLSQDCWNGCKYSSRKKRHISDDELSGMNSVEYGIKKVPQEEFVNDPALDDLVIASSDGLTVSENKHKRERDNRPKYNPGWIFIGLGKRSLDNKDPEADKIDRSDFRIIHVDKPDSLLTKYYKLINKLKDRLQKVKYNLLNTGHNGVKHLFPFHNIFLAENGLRGYPNVYNMGFPIIKHNLDVLANNPPPEGDDPFWNIDYSPSVEDQEISGK